LRSFTREFGFFSKKRVLFGKVIAGMLLCHTSVKHLHFVASNLASTAKSLEVNQMGIGWVK